MRTAVSALIALAVAASAFGSTKSVQRAQLPSIVKTARFVTLQRWDGRANEMLASYGQAHQAPAAWRAGDPHWEQAKTKLLARLGKAIDDLASAPDSEALVAKGFTQMSDQEADAAAARLTPEILSYSDLLIVTVEAMGDLNTTNSIDPAVLEVRKRWGGTPPPPDSPVYQAAREKNVSKLIDARSSAVRFLSTGLDGQLQLFLFDHQQALARDFEAAIAECKKAKH